MPDVGYSRQCPAMLANMNIRALAMCASAMTFSVVGPAMVLASDRDFGFSIGYAHLSVDDEALDDLDNQVGVRFEPRVTWAPWDNLPQLRIGIGIGFSFFYDEEDTGQTVGGFADIEDFEQISLIVPELQATWWQPLSEHYFIEGGVGIAAVIG